MMGVWKIIWAKTFELRLEESNVGDSFKAIERIQVIMRSIVSGSKMVTMITG